MDTDFTHRLQAQDRRLDRIEHTLFGNGVAGMDETVRKHTESLDKISGQMDELGEKLDEISDKVSSLSGEREKDLARREGSVKTLRWVQWGLVVITILVGIIGSYIYSGQQMVLEQLQRIPPLPLP